MTNFVKSQERMPFSFECLQFVLQDHNYGAPPPRTPPSLSPTLNLNQQPVKESENLLSTAPQSYAISQGITERIAEEDTTSVISSEAGREVELEGEETETAPEGEGEDDDSITRCICEFQHDDGYMICCDRCLVWQHVDCMGIDRTKIPDEYHCEMCKPRRIDQARARALQMRKREELFNSDSSSSESFASSASANDQTVKQQKRSGRKKTERWMSLKEKNEKRLDTCKVTPLRHWIDRYEEAVTNHYSPELRSRISNIKVNDCLDDLKLSNLGNAKYRLCSQSNNVKYLVATNILPANTPVIEITGKFMLSTQYKLANSQSSDHMPEAEPFVFFYRFPNDSLEVCVDMRTYGNDSRFVRHSCKPNAEIKHCIRKGILYLYIVTCETVEKNMEVTLSHYKYYTPPSTNSSSASIPDSCACNDPVNCKKAYSISYGINSEENTISSIKNIDFREKRRKIRKKILNETYDETFTKKPMTTTENDFHSSAVITTQVDSSVCVTQSSPSSTSSSVTNINSKFKSNFYYSHEILSLASSITQNMDDEKSKNSSNKLKNILDSNRLIPKMLPEKNLSNINVDQKKEKKKMTREERKMEAIMKAFERLEKAEQKKQEILARNAQRKESSAIHSDNDDQSILILPEKVPNNKSDKETPKRRKKKGRTRSRSITRRFQLNSAESDFTSGDENQFLQSSSTVKLTGNSKTSKSENSVNVLLTLSTSNNSDLRSPTRTVCRSTPTKSPSVDSNSSQGSMPSTPLSSACLLVAAAVGPLAPGFKFPKTKKLLMNEWLREAPDQSIEFSGSNKGNSSLTSFEHSTSCDTSPQRVTCQISGSAKKRWLRQAISEECDSPCSPIRPESPPSEMIAPPKKRRTARESLSSDNCTPPTTPTMLNAENLNTTLGKSFIAEDEYIERTLSPNTNEFVAIETLHKVIEEPDELKHCFNTKKDAELINDLSSTSCVFKHENKNFPSIHPKEDNRVEDNVVNFICQGIQIKSKADLMMSTYSSFNITKDPKKLKNLKDQDVLYSIIGDLNSSSTTLDTRIELREKKSVTSSIINDCISQSKLKVDVESFQEQNNEHMKANDEKKHVKMEHVTCIDEFDVEAQIKKITGDEGDDSIIFKTSNDKNFKKVSGIKDIIESSKEDSDSENDEKGFENTEKNNYFCSSHDEIKNDKEESNFYEQNLNNTTLIFDEPDKIVEQVEKFIEKTQVPIKNCSRNDPRNSLKLALCNFEEVSTANSEESKMKISKKMCTQKSNKNSMKYFPAIPPLSERIKKRTDSSLSLKSKMEIEASKIESSIDFELDKIDMKYEDKLVSLALSELSESEILHDNKLINKTKRQSELEKQKNTTPILHNEKINFTDDNSTCRSEILPTVDSSGSFTEKNVISQVESKVEPHSKAGSFSLEPQKLKDPRTAVPNKLVQIQITKKSPEKRKLSITEYRKRKQQSETSLPELDNKKLSTDEKNTLRERSDSASSGTSTLSSEGEIAIKTTSDSHNLNILPILSSTDGDEKKGTDEGMIGWSAAPTLVERQRENLTERLKREFGLFLNDDDEENVRNQGINGNNLGKSAILINSNCNSIGYSTAQLPPQPYIPPPGTALMNYSTKTPNPTSAQFTDYSVPETFKIPNHLPFSMNQSAIILDTKQQFTISQAPPGSNPYPPIETTASSQNKTSQSPPDLDSLTESLTVSIS